MSRTQRAIIHYSLLSFFGLLGAVVIAMIASVAGALMLGADWMGDQNIQNRVVWATMLLTVLIWLPFHLWCRRQVICPVCSGSVFQTFWQVTWDFGGGASTSNVRTQCPKCSAQLP